MSSESKLVERSAEPPAVQSAGGRGRTGYRGQPNAEMHTIGLLYVAGLVILFIPLLPFAVVGWAIWRVARATQSFVGGEADETAERTRPRRRGPAA